MLVIMCHLNSFVNSLSFFYLSLCNPQRLCVGFAVSLIGMRISNGVEKKKQIIARFNGHSYAVLKSVITNLNAFNSNHMSNSIIFIHTVCRGFVSLFSWPMQ